MKGTALKKKKTPAFLSGNKYQHLSDMESSRAKKPKNKAQLLITECAEIFQSVRCFSQGENKRKEEPKESVVMTTSKRRTNPRGHICSKGKEVLISSIRAQQEQTETRFNKTLLLKTRTHQVFACPLWGYTAKLTLADLADTKSRSCEGKKKILITWAMIQ